MPVGIHQAWSYRQPGAAGAVCTLELSTADSGGLQVATEHRLVGSEPSRRIDRFAICERGRADAWIEASRALLIKGGYHLEDERVSEVRVPGQVDGRLLVHATTRKVLAPVLL